MILLRFVGRVKKIKMEKIGSIKFQDFETDFFMTPKVKEELEKNKHSFATLIPGGWVWFETMLFDIIDADEDGVPEEEFGKKFKAIYYGIIRGRDFVEGNLVENLDLDDVSEMKDRALAIFENKDFKLMVLKNE